MQMRPEDADLQSKITNILERYLQPGDNISLPDAVQKLLKLLIDLDLELRRQQINGLTSETMYCMDSDEPDPSSESVSRLLESSLPHVEFSNIAIETGRQIPYDHAAHVKFARLLSHLTPRTDDPGHTWASSYPLPRPATRSLLPYWETVDFRVLLEDNNQAFRSSSKVDLEDDVEDFLSAHVNFHPFAAHMGQFGLINITHLATLQLRECFEYGWEHGQSFRVRGQIETSQGLADMLDVPVKEFDIKLRSFTTMAAAMWVRVNGSSLFTETVRRPKEWTGDLKERQFVAGSLFQGPIFGIER